MRMSPMRDEPKKEKAVTEVRKVLDIPPEHRESIVEMLAEAILRVVGQPNAKPTKEEESNG
jgi:hypothetical protein